MLHESEFLRSAPRRARTVVGLLLSTGALLSCGESASEGAPPEEPVEFENLRVEELAARRAVIRFDTTRPTSCEVEYGDQQGQLVLTATDPDMAEGERSLEHEVSLEDLNPETKYFFRARAVDGWDQIFFSDVSSLTTLPESGAETRINLALVGTGASVSAVSSNWAEGDNDSGFGANKAIDGQMGTEWSSDGDGDDAFIEIDLGGAKTISTIAFRSRQMTDGTAIIERVQFELGPTNAIVGPLDTPDPSQKYQLDFSPLEGVETVRLIVLKSTGGNTGAREIEVYGE